MYTKEMNAKLDAGLIADLGKDAIRVTLECDRGHTKGFALKADRSEGRFLDGADWVGRSSKQSYAYRNGGCCYRAAVEALLSENVFHGVD